MATVALVTADTVRVVETREQDTHPAAVDVTAGNRIIQNSAGKWALAGLTDTGAYIATRTVRAGQALTGLKKGVMDGFDLSALAYGATVYSLASGGIQTTNPGTAVVVGQVIAAHSNYITNAADKILRVDCA